MKFLWAGVGRSGKKSGTGGKARSQRLDFLWQPATPVIAAAVVATVLKPKASHAVISEEEDDPVEMSSASSRASHLLSCFCRF